MSCQGCSVDSSVTRGLCVIRVSFFCEAPTLSIAVVVLIGRVFVDGGCGCRTVCFGSFMICPGGPHVMWGLLPDQGNAALRTDLHACRLPIPRSSPCFFFVFFVFFFRGVKIAIDPPYFPLGTLFRVVESRQQSIQPRTFHFHFSPSFFNFYFSSSFFHFHFSSFIVFHFFFFISSFSSFSFSHIYYPTSPRVSFTYIFCLLIVRTFLLLM